MKKCICFILLILFCVFPGVMAFAEMPSARPAALWKYITEESPYTKWSFWPDHQGMQPGASPHGSLHKVFVNEKGISSTTPPVQYGTIAVKENYNIKKELQAITVMYKVKGYRQDAGNWYWVKYSPEGKTERLSNEKGCLGCHSTRQKNDFILVHEFE
jgi:cytochrome P460